MLMLMIVLKSLLLIVLALAFTRLAMSAWKKSKEPLWVKIPLVLLMVAFVGICCVYFTVVFIYDPHRQ